MRELYVEEPEREKPWEERVGLWLDLVFDEIPLPQDFQERLAEEYKHLWEPEPPRGEENKRAWEAYTLWVGDFTEDLRSPRERLEAYFEEQRRRVEGHV